MTFSMLFILVTSSKLSLVVFFCRIVDFQYLSNTPRQQMLIDFEDLMSLQIVPKYEYGIENSHQSSSSR